MPRQEAEQATTDITEVAPGILRMQLPLHMPGLGHVNCYAMEDERGWTVVDPGMPGPQPWKALVDRFQRAGIALRNVHSVVVTHSHVDHFGASGRLLQLAPAFEDSTYWPKVAPGPKGLMLGLESTQLDADAVVKPTSQYVVLAASVN